MEKSHETIQDRQLKRIESLTSSIESLKKANQTYIDRLTGQSEHHNVRLEVMQEKIESQSIQINAKRTYDRRDLTLERIDTFFSGTELKLPEEALNGFLAKCRKTASDQKVDELLEQMEKTQYRAFFEQLFAVEMDMAQGFDFIGLGPIVTFQRGETDIAHAAKEGITIDEMKANQIRLTKERFDEFIKPEFISPEEVEAVCEIGAAWGAATRYMINRFEPTTFHSYEIDTGWAQWLQDNLGVDSKTCDGESLSDTEENSMDMCMASSCLYFMPFIKQWNYLAEFARVLRPGGIAVFNQLVTETMTIRSLKGLLANHFPRRSFGYIPQHCIDIAFPKDKFEKLIEDPKKTMGYQVYRKL